MHLLIEIFGLIQMEDDRRVLNTFNQLALRVEKYTGNDRLMNIGQ